MRLSIGTSLILTLLFAADPAASATRPLEPWAALTVQDATAVPDLYAQLKDAIDWNKPAPVGYETPAVLLHVLQVYAALVATALVVQRLPAPRR